MERTETFIVSFSSGANTISSGGSEFTTINNKLNLKANSTALADAYTTGASYAVGDYCSYICDLYVCTTAIASAPSTFDTTKWAKVPVADYIVGATAAEVQAVITNYTAT